MQRYIFITGGVVSSLGKGLASAALGALLHNKKGSVDGADADGCTPLLIATRLGSLEHIQLLIQKGANPTVKDRNGNSALSIAAESQDDELLKVIPVDFSK